MAVNIRSGLDIVRMHQDFIGKITELEHSIGKLGSSPYTVGVLEDTLKEMREALQTLEDTRFQPLDRVVIGPSMLGAIQKYGDA